MQRGHHRRLLHPGDGQQVRLEHGRQPVVQRPEPVRRGQQGMREGDPAPTPRGSQICTGAAYGGSGMRISPTIWPMYQPATIACRSASDMASDASRVGPGDRSSTPPGPAGRWRPTPGRPARGRSRRPAASRAGRSRRRRSVAGCPGRSAPAAGCPGCDGSMFGLLVRISSRSRGDGEVAERHRGELVAVLDRVAAVQDLHGLLVDADQRHGQASVSRNLSTTSRCRACCSDSRRAVLR